MKKIWIAFYLAGLFALVLGTLAFGEKRGSCPFDSCGTEIDALLHGRDMECPRHCIATLQSHLMQYRLR